MRSARSATFVLTALLVALTVPCLAHAEPELPRTVPDAADAVVAAAQAKDTKRLETLATLRRPDPWQVADELCRRGAFDEATAFASATSHPAIGKLADYVATCRKAGDDTTARKALAAMADATNAKDNAKVIELAPSAAAEPKTVVAMRAAYLHALALFELKKLDESLAMFEATAQTARAVGWRRWSAECLHQAGVIAYRSQKPRETLRLWRARVDDERAIQNVSGMASVLNNLGTLQLQMQESVGAIASFEEALPLLRKVGNERALTGALNNLGVVLERTGDFKGAIERHEEALALKRKNGANAKDIAGSLRNIGGAYEGLRNYERALAAYEESLEIARKAGDRQSIARSLNNIGTVQERLANYDAAIKSYEASLAMKREVGDQWGIAATLNNLGVVYLHLRDYEKTLEYYEASLEIKRALGDRASMASTLSNIGNVYEHQGRLAEAVAKYQESLAIDRGLGNKAGVAATLNNLGVVQRRLTQYDAARATYAEALRLQEGTADLEVLARLSWGMALIELQTGEPTKAIEWILKGVAHVDEISRGLAEDEGAGARELFDEMFQDGYRAAAQAGDAAKLTELLERGRAAAFRLSLGSRQQLESAVIPTKLLAALEDARRLERAAVATYERTRRRDRRLQKIREARAAWDAARSAIDAVSKRIERAAKRAASVTLSDPDDLATIQGQLEPSEALVYYTLTFRGALAFVVRKDRTQIVDLGPTVTINAVIERLLTGDKHIDVTQVPAMQALLAEPLQLGKDVRRLLISPMGRLGFVPFALLFPEHEIAYVPSGTSHGLLRQDRALLGGKVLGLGDPDYASGGTMSLPRLHASRGEVEAVADVRLLGKDAAETGLPKAIAAEERWRAIHFACHGLVDPEQPMLSSLALTPDASNDGYLRALDIFRMKIPADLVVLSACETGKGKIYRTEGIVGLTRAFMFAGSPRVLCSLWQVDDEATRALMVKFYELWNPKKGEGIGAAAALKQAQAHVRAQKQWAHPYYWAAWVLWGLPK